MDISYFCIVPPLSFSCIHQSAWVVANSVVPRATGIDSRAGKYQHAICMHFVPPLPHHLLPITMTRVLANANLAFHSESDHDSALASVSDPSRCWMQTPFLHNIMGG